MRAVRMGANMSIREEADARAFEEFEEFKALVKKWNDDYKEKPGRLKVLEQAGLISRRRRATARLRHLEAEPLREATA